MSQVSGEDIERLASRMAMLVSDDGEADNAGRAVGQLARRLGLSGGDLKQIVLLGAGTGYQPGSHPGMARLEQEIGALRRALAEAEEGARSARQAREALVAENGAMRVAMYRQQASRRLQRLMLALGLIGVGVVGVAMVFFGPNLFDPPPRVEPGAGLARPAPPVVTATGRVGVVRKDGARLFLLPERKSDPVNWLKPNTRLTVTAQVPGYMPWAQVDWEGRVYFVPMDELEIR